MHKYFKIFFICLIFPLFITGCNSNFISTLKNPLRISKPSPHFYTDNLIRTLKNYENITISIFYPKTGKNKTIPKDYMEQFYSFIDSIKEDYFIDKTISNLNLDSPEYRLTVYVNKKSAFIINLINNKYITIHPWDGTYPPDIIDISSLHTRNNIFNITEFLIKNHSK